MFNPPVHDIDQAEESQGLPLYKNKAEKRMCSLIVLQTANGIEIAESNITGVYREDTSDTSA
jgi:hypothetical protein